MKRKRLEPRTLIVHYCFAMVLAGCVGVSLNKQIFEQNNAYILPAEVTAEATTSSSESIPTTKPTPIEEKAAQANEASPPWTKCPTHEDVNASIKSCRHLIASTVKITACMRSLSNGKPARDVSKDIEKWREEARAWKEKNDGIIGRCDCLLGATGVQVFPEIPLALQNLKRAGTWLDWSFEAEEFGEHQEAAAYTAAAKRAANQAGKLIDHKIKPWAPGALVKLPKHLEKFSLSSI